MLHKYYSLDECYEKDKVFDHLENLQDEELIVYEILDSDIIKIKDIGLSDKQSKDLEQFFDSNDVIDYDYEDFDEDGDEDGDYDDYPSDDYF